MLTIQFGQCGNQLGYSLFSLLSSDINSRDKTLSRELNYLYAESAFEKWFEGITKDGKLLARAILIDTEQKVLRNICKISNSKWTYHPHNLICQAGGGSANNWAYGYLIKGPQLKEETLEAVRKEAERVDRLEGILLLLSSAGGTGSGVGSYFVELLREDFPTKTLVGSTVLPFASGEVGTQNYNTLLTLAKFNEKCDADFLFENDQIHSICTNVLKNMETTLGDMNEVISKKLSSIFQPLENSINTSTFISLIAPHPNYRLAFIKSVPFIPSNCIIYESSRKWHSYIQHLKQTLRIRTMSSELIDAKSKKLSYSSNERSFSKYYTSVSNILITRGMSFKNDPITYDDMNKQNLYVNWISEADRFTYFNQKRGILNQEKFATLVTNNSQIYQPLEFIVDQAWKMYTHAAFLHQYKKFGFEEDDFLHSFAKVENVVKSYKELDRN